MLSKAGAAAAFLLVLGLLQMTGDMLQLPRLKALGAVTGASPAPKVFSSIQGLETFSTKFFIDYEDASGAIASVALTPALYAGVRGPYNRRNVYGAALAYGPVLASDPRTAPLFRAVTRHALCGKAPLLREIGLDPAAIVGPVRVRLVPLPGSPVTDLPLVFEAPCG
ncbi:MAG: hypothetical protein Q8R92_11860 [Deltaproteobacteria bacterium]|nr:hypothetical protein [Deltaproteobacteria bacterium]